MQDQSIVRHFLSATPSLRRRVAGAPRSQRERTLQAAGRIMSGHDQLHFENRYVRKDGQLVDIMWSARWSEADQLRIAVARDITASKRIESMQVALYAISEAAHAAEDLLSLIRKIHQVIDVGGGRALRVPPSVGMACYPEHGIDSAQLLKHADEAMYDEKKRGRRAARSLDG